MNILLVDDQPSVLSSLKSGLNWSALLVHNVYTALNASEASEIILSHPIYILLTDIEMPKESGLSLLRWCRENHYQFECIFLTSHADFFYAQEAIQLESFDYILQPARYEDIESAIKPVSYTHLLSGINSYVTRFPCMEKCSKAVDYILPLVN